MMSVAIQDGRRVFSAGPDGFRAACLPIVASTYFIPFPGVGAYTMPAVMTALIVLDFGRRWSLQELALGILCLTLSGFAFLVDIEKGLFALSISVALFGGMYGAKLRSDYALGPALLLHVGFAALSTASLVVSGEDVVPAFLYGETRHAVHANEFISARISGLYQEPSTFGLHMLLLSLLPMGGRARFYEVSFLCLAIVSTSMITLFALARLAWVLRAQVLTRAGLWYVVLLTPFVALIVVPALLFMGEKVWTYADTGILESTRFVVFAVAADVVLGGAVPWFGLSEDALKDFVVYDTGLFISTPLLLGFIGLPFLLLFIYLALRKPFMLLMGLTKMTISNPLAWAVLMRYERQRSTRTTQGRSSSERGQLERGKPPESPVR